MGGCPGKSSILHLQELLALEFKVQSQKNRSLAVDVGLHTKESKPLGPGGQDLAPKGAIEVCQVSRDCRSYIPSSSGKHLFSLDSNWESSQEQTFQLP